LMRPAAVSALLAHVSAIVLGSAGCNLHMAQGSCDNYVANQKTMEVQGDVACSIAKGAVTSTTTSSTPIMSAGCNTTCGSGFGGCYLPDDYIHAFVAARAAVADAGSSDASAEAGAGAGDAGENDAGAPVCPVVAGTVKVKCTSFCEG